MTEGEAKAISPSEELADIIVAELSEEGLLHEDDARRMILAISSGKAKAEDWRVAVEKVIDREKEGE